MECLPKSTDKVGLCTSRLQQERGLGGPNYREMLFAAQIGFFFRNKKHRSKTGRSGLLRRLSVSSVARCRHRRCGTLNIREVVSHPGHIFVNENNTIYKPFMSTKTQKMGRSKDNLSAQLCRSHILWFRFDLSERATLLKNLIGYGALAPYSNTSREKKKLLTLLGCQIPFKLGYPTL